ncbi:MAG: SDR family oxidoreductase [Planctomycetes bacterium]|nr:SDR family oxidoreductase [Planctomycetota bacterium]
MSPSPTPERSAPFRLDGRVAMVTGASRGIGEATARVLAAAGARTVLVARQADRLEEIARQLQEAGHHALACPANVSLKAEVHAAVAHTLDQLGRIDVLVNNAGIRGKSPLDEMPEQEWNEVLGVNLTGPFLCAQAVVPSMKRQRWGRIINVSSISGQTGGVAGTLPYSASKGGLFALTKTLSRDLAPFGITVNAIAPGQIETGTLSTERRESVVKLIPLGKLGQPVDIAYAALFLASEEAGYITGATLDVNGGILKR